MKRPGRLRRSGGLKPGGPLKRTAGGLTRSGPIKRKPKPALHPELARLSRELREAWKASTEDRCAACGAIGVTIQGHHVVRQQLIKAAVQGMGGERILRALWDVRNRLALCEDCHRRHHSRLGTLAWSLIERLAPEAIVFAHELDLLWRAKLDYNLEA